MSCYSTKAQRIHTVTLSSLEYTDLNQQKCFEILVHTFTFVHHSSAAEFSRLVMCFFNHKAVTNFFFYY